MGYLNVRSFIFDGISSDAYGVGIGWLKNDNKEIVSTGLNVNIQQGSTNMERYEANQYGVIYQDQLGIEIGIYKLDGTNFSYEESHRINKWLRKSNVYKKFYFDDDNPETVHFYAICTNIEDVVLTGITMKKLTFMCNSPFGYAKEFNKIIKSTSTAKEVKIINQSDCGDYYPVIKIETSDSYTGSFVIENLTEDKKMTINFDNIPSISDKKVLVINCKRSTITDGDGNLLPLYKIGWDELTNIYWFRLTEDANMIRIKGEGTVTMSFEFPKKVGII